MTKKDYIKLAAIIKNNIVTETWIDNGITKMMNCEHLNLSRFINDLCAMLKADNPHFDEAKFRKAINS